jgi:hypothetical protein
MNAMLVKAVRWLLGGRTTGIVGMSDSSNLQAWGPYYVVGAPGIGTAARNALTAAGYTVYSYTGSNSAAEIGNCDVLMLGGEAMADYTDLANRTATLRNWVTSGAGAIFQYAGHAPSPMGTTPFACRYSGGGIYFAGPHDRAWMVDTAGDPAGTVPAGALGDTWVAGVSDEFYLRWGLQITIDTVIAGVYPDGFNAAWDFNSQYVIGFGGGLYHGPIMGAYTAHGDLGHDGVAHA